MFAEFYLEAGISIIPLKLDGSKSPAVRSWNPYRSKFPSRGELVSWFGVQKYGIGMVCGIQSGGLEVLDFDEEADETFHEWRSQLPPSIFGRLCVCETGGHGYHVIYRCSQICGNQKIAMTENDSVLVESRGEGGYIVAVGSPTKVHPSGFPYVQVAGEPLPNVPVFTPEERKTLWVAASKLDRSKKTFDEFVKKRVKQLRPKIDKPKDGSTPWDDFNLRGDWADILSSHGWHSGDGVHWTRAGKSGGTSATVRQADDGADVLCVFSANAGVLSPQGNNHRNWSKFNAYAELNHGGDGKAAGRELRFKGYGGNR